MGGQAVGPLTSRRSVLLGFDYDKQSCDEQARFCPIYKHICQPRKGSTSYWGTPAKLLVVRKKYIDQNVGVVANTDSHAVAAKLPAGRRRFFEL